MTEKGVILVTLDSRDMGKVLGAGRASEVPDWRDQVVHSSHPALPLNDRSPRFLTISRAYPTTSRPDLAIIEVTSTVQLDRQNVPLIRVLGHTVTVHFDLGTTTPRESQPVGAFWEIRVDGKTIGAIDGGVDDLQTLGSLATDLATKYISRIVAEGAHKF